MAQKLLSLDEAAARLGISSDDLVRLIDQRKIFAIKDGGSWKFKPDEVDRYKADRSGSSSGSAEKAYYLPESDESQDDGGLITDAMLGGLGHGSSTVIGPSGEAVLGQDSDLTLGSGSGTGSDSDVKLVADADLDSGGSGIKLVPNVGGPGASGSDLQMVDLNSGSGTFKLKDDDVTIEAKPGSGGKLGGSSGKLAGGSGGKLGGSSGKLGGKSSGKLGAGSDLTISESGLSLGEDDDILIGGSSGHGMGSSKTKLPDQQFEDDDIVLGGSSGGSGLGSGIGDSGINLAAAADSGLSLEEPLELSGEDGLSDESGETEMSSDDDFLLTPMLELDDQDSSDSSGSQVIALDSEAVVDDQAATLLGGDAVTATMAGPASQAMGPGPVMMVPAAPQAQHSGFTVSFLVLSFLVLAMAGMMMFEMIRDIWSWDGPSSASATIMNGIIGLFGG